MEKNDKVEKLCGDFVLFLKKLRIKGGTGRQYVCHHSIISTNGIFARELLESTILLKGLTMRQELISYILRFGEPSVWLREAQRIKRFEEEALSVITLLKDQPSEAPFQLAILCSAQRTAFSPFLTSWRNSASCTPKITLKCTGGRRGCGFVEMYKRNPLPADIQGNCPALQKREKVVFQQDRT
nr:hypothetical protein [Lunatimonas lonarensis]